MMLNKKKLYEKIKEKLKERWLQLHPGTEERFAPAAPYYFTKVEDNLAESMSDRIRHCYENASGNELAGKMCALHSSSAMAFNMFGNGLVRIKPNPYALKPATYTVEYEKKLSVLNPVRPANIDVYLASDDELMLFEMKMTEWLRDDMSGVSKTYGKREKFPDADIYAAWHNAARAVAKDREKEKEKELYVSGNQHIDVYQALKHILGIYKGLFYTHELPRMKKVTLILGIWTANSDIFASSIKPSHSGIDNPEVEADALGETYKEYQKFEQAMRSEFALFHAAIAEIICVFAQLGVHFDVRLLTVREIVSCLEKSPEDMKKLQRYL